MEFQLLYGNHQTSTYRRTFIVGRGMYALPVQAVVASKLRFLYMSFRCSGSTHDAVAFDTSELAAKLRSGAMRPGYGLEVTLRMFRCLDC